MRAADLILAIVLCAVAGWMMSCMHDRTASRPVTVEAVREPALQRLLSEAAARLPVRPRAGAVIPAEPAAVPVGHRFHPDSNPSTANPRRSGDYQC